MCACRRSRRITCGGAARARIVLNLHAEEPQDSRDFMRVYFDEGKSRVNLQFGRGGSVSAGDHVALEGLSADWIHEAFAGYLVQAAKGSAFGRRRRQAF
jgi:hypothetical protein